MIYVANNGRILGKDDRIAHVFPKVVPEEHGREVLEVSKKLK